MPREKKHGKVTRSRLRDLRRYNRSLRTLKRKAIPQEMENADAEGSQRKRPRGQRGGKSGKRQSNRELKIYRGLQEPNAKAKANLQVLNIDSHLRGRHGSIMLMALSRWAVPRNPPREKPPRAGCRTKLLGRNQLPKSEGDENDLTGTLLEYASRHQSRSRYQDSGKEVTSAPDLLSGEEEIDPEVSHRHGDQPWKVPRNLELHSSHM